MTCKVKLPSIKMKTKAVQFETKDHSVDMNVNEWSERHRSLSAIRARVVR